MFTGIILKKGKIKSLQNGSSNRVVVAVPGLKARRGDSVAIDGVCLTVARKTKTGFVFDLLKETLRVTTLKGLKPGAHVNVEPALRAGDPLGGHLVMGHVDGVGRVSKRRRLKSDLILQIQASKSLYRYLVPKGSVAINGVSLTIVSRSTGGAFSVALIPVTQKETNLSQLEVGDFVNCEVDPIARYVFGSAR
jgi:riboflavin synthase alpha subunit